MRERADAATFTMRSPIMNAKIPPEAYPYHHNSSAPPDFRASARREEEERAYARLKELELQTSASYSPEERIRLWERLHALRLPTSAAHPLIAVIATHTQLTVHAIRDEQQRRRESVYGAKEHDTP